MGSGDFLANPSLFFECHGEVGETMISDRMPVPPDFTHKTRVQGRLVSGEEKSGRDFSFCKNLKNRSCVCRIRAVIEGQEDSF